MATAKRVIVQRIDVSKNNSSTLSHARSYACAELIVVLLIFACGVLFVLALNALIPARW